MFSRARWMALSAILLLSACATVPPPPPPPDESVDGALPGFLVSALEDPGRPAADMAKDALRRPGETLAFAGLRPGMKVADLIPGQGYFTRIFSKAVGPKGRVFAYVPDELTKLANREPAVAALARDRNYPNIRLVLNTLPMFATPERLDMVFTAQNYHDMHADFMGPVDVAQVNRQIYASLKPGGVYIVIDHSARAGSGLGMVNELHRIDAALVRREIEAAGFVFEREARFLANPKDPRTKSVFDASIRGKTDQFVMKFRKPGRARR